MLHTVVPIIIGFIALLVLASGIFLMYHTKDYVKVTGRVVSTDMFMNSEKRMQYTVRSAYIVDTTVYFHSSTSSSYSEYERGQNIDLYYNPAAPEKAIDYTFDMGRMLGMIVVPALVLMGVISMMIAAFKRREGEARAVLAARKQSPYIPPKPVAMDDLPPPPPPPPGFS